MSTCSFLLCLWLQACFFVPSKSWLFSNDNCYSTPDVGCFPTSRPFTNAMGFAPISPQSLDLHFIYKDDGADLRFPLQRVSQAMRSKYNPLLKTVLVIHGYMETPNRGWVNALVTALKTQTPMNIFVVDWSAGAFHFNYFQCVANARVAGAVSALFLEELLAMGGHPSNVHIVGFSLGAHVAGYIGKRTPGLGRITGLDPAGPGFFGTARQVRLHPRDAVVVDVIHTDTELGSLMPFGTIDYYPNGGSDQPSCGNGYMDRLSTLFSRMDFSRNTVTRTVGCSHIRATELFIASIVDPCSFEMTQCPSLNAMTNGRGVACLAGDCPRFGYHLDYSRTPRPGLYLFTTVGTFPYC